MKRLEQYMPIAIDVVEDMFLRETGKVDEKLDNLVSRFGVAIRQMGLKTAVTAFSESMEKPENPNPAKNPKLAVTKAVLRIIKQHEGKICAENESLFGFVALNSADVLLKSKIMDASVALKLALRLFIENEKNESEREVEDGQQE